MTSDLTDDGDLGILPWDVLKIGGLVDCEARVIWASADRQALALMRLDDVSWPELVPFAHATAMVREHAWQHEPGEPPVYPPLSSLTKTQLEKRDAHWNLLGFLFEDQVPAIFEKKKRAQLIRQIVANSESTGNRVSRRHVENLLKRAFKGGMTKDSLRAWERCGKGERRPVEELQKLGRKPAPGHPEGLNVDSEMKRLFALSLRRFWADNKKLDMRGAYNLCMRLFFMDIVGDALEGGTHLPKDRYRELGLPTYEQFRYWAPKVVDLNALGRKRNKARIWDQKNRPILKTSLSITWGPGGRFQIDATVLDIYVRSRANSRVLIGRPTLYVVIDTFSRLIVGIYIGLENPSWVAAMMALANCAEDKVEFCRRHDVTITEEDWPANVIPAAVLGDKGEMERQFADNMIDLMNIVVENAAPYRGDWKGIVESCFRTLPAIFKPFVPGYIETDFRQRGTRDYRADAVLDMDDLTRIIIELVLYHNNDKEIDGYPRHEMLDEQDVPSVPRDLWNWGIVNLSGIPRQPDYDRLRFGLMPQADAVVTEAGIVFEGRYYTCPTAQKRDWFVKARQRNSYSVRVSYDKRRTSTIMVHVPGSPGFEVGRRISKGVVEDRDLTAWEEEGRRRQSSSRKANRRDQETVSRANTDAKVIAIAERAKLKSAGVVGGSVASQVKNIRDNRAAELEIDRAAEAERYAAGLGAHSDAAGGDGDDGSSANVLAFPGGGQAGFSIPDFASDMPLKGWETDDE